MNKYYKILIVGLMIAAEFIWMMNRQIGWGIVVIFFLSPILLFFKNEYIYWHFLANEKTEFCKKSHWLTYIAKLPILSCNKSQYGYFHYFKGLTLAQEHPAKVEPLMKKAF